MKVALSIGHSTKDPGAVSFHNGIKYKEYDLNKALFDEVIKLPLQHGTWWQSDQLCDDLPYPKHLIKTIRQINAHNPVCCIELHHNSVWNKDVRGGMAIYWDTSVKGKALSDMIAWQLDFLPHGIGFDGVKKHWVNIQHKYYTAGSLSTLRHINRRLAFLRPKSEGGTQCPACIVEPGFMSNWEDIQFCMKHCTEIARAIRNGVDAWCKAQ